MGVFDFPAPIFAWLDAQAAALIPPLGRLILWGIVAGGISMGLYRALSDQARIYRTKAEVARLRERLEAHDGDFASAASLIGSLLRTALKQVRLVAWPAALSSLPLLALVCWLSTAYGYAYPLAGTIPSVRTMPPELRVDWVAAARPEPQPSHRPTPRIRVSNESREIVADVALAVPVPIIHKWRWWNALIANPIGYLPNSAAVDWIEVDLPHRQYLDFGPQWLRGWEAPFFLSVVGISIMVKARWRIA